MVVRTQTRKFRCLVCGIVKTASAIKHHLKTKHVREWENRGNKDLYTPLMIEAETNNLIRNVEVISKDILNRLDNDIKTLKNINKGLKE